MLKRKLCELTVELSCRCEGPLLIADNRWTSAKGLPDKVFISRSPVKELERVFTSTMHDDAQKLDYFIPATSLRGPLRARAEMIVRTLAAGSARPPATACDPFEQDGSEMLQSCSKRLERTTDKYKQACPACRLFGCAGLASRSQIDEGAIDRSHSAYRDMIGIDRLVGKVKANIKDHVLEDCHFRTKIGIVNFELWQVGLLAHVLKDFAEGSIRFGHGKAKGFGEVIATVDAVHVSYPASQTSGEFHHLASLCDEAERQKYDLPTAPSEAPGLKDVELERDNEDAFALSLYSRQKVVEPDRLWRAAAPALNDYLQQLGNREDAA